MASLNEIQEDLGRLMTEARGYLDEADSETDEARKAELNEMHDKAMAQYDETYARFEREQRQAEVEQKFAERLEENERRVREERRPPVVEGRAESPQYEDDRPGITYRDAFHEYLKSGGQVGNLPAEHRALLVGSGINDSTNGPKGGFTAPEEFMAQIVRAMEAFGPMYSSDMFTVMNTDSGNKIQFPKVDDTPSAANWSGTAANTTYRKPRGRSENSSPEDLVVGTGANLNQDPVFAKGSLDAFSYGTPWIHVSRELMDDSAIAFEALIGSLIGERLGRVANEQLTVGDGSGDPQGIVTGASEVDIGIGASDALKGDDLIDLVHELDPAYRSSPSVAFMMNDKTFATIRKMKSSGGEYIFNAGSDVVGSLVPGIPGRLLGYPVVINQDIADVPGAAGNARALLFGDMSKYIVRKVGGISIGALTDTTNWPNVSIAGTVRLDGQISDTRGIKAAKITYT